MNYDNLESSSNQVFWPLLSPAFTLQTLVERKEVEYLPGYLIEQYEEHKGGVTVSARNLNDDTLEKFQGRKLILCLGAFNTARLVLFSNRDFSTELPVVENPFSLIPLVSVTRIGRPIDKESYSSQLCFVYSGELCPELIIGMIYGIEGLPRSDLLFDFPFSVSGCIAAAKYLLPAMAVLQVYHPSDPQEGNTLKINEQGSMIIQFNRSEFRSIEKHLLTVFRRIGYLSASFLIQPNEPGLKQPLCRTVADESQPPKAL